MSNNDAPSIRDQSCETAARIAGGFILILDATALSAANQRIPANRNNGQLRIVTSY